MTDARRVRTLSRLELKTGEAEARERMRAYLAGSSLGDRPALWVTCDLPARGPATAAAPAPSPAAPATSAPQLPAAQRTPDLARKAADLDAQWHIEQIEAELAGTAFLAEAMPCATIMVGTDITNSATLLGGDYDYFYGEAIIRRAPGILQAPVPAFDPEWPFVRRLTEVYRTVAAHLGRRAFLNTVTSLDALTTMSQLFGPVPFCREFIERPAWVARKTVEITELYLAFYRHLYELLLDLGHGESSAWFHTMAEGPFDVLRTDVAVMISPAMFEQMGVPQLRAQSEGLEHCLFNMDSVKMLRFVPALGGIATLDGIYWNPEPMHAGLRPWLEPLRDIRRREMILEITAPSVEDACAAAQELGPDGLLISLPRFASPDEGADAIDRVRAACRRARAR